MRGGIVVLAALLATAASAASHGKHTPATFAEPGDIIAAEGNFTHLSAAKGVRAAIRATAQSDARIYAPQALLATDYAKTASDAQLGTQWHTRQVWMSCDGSFAVTHGDWQRGPALGWTITIWHRQKGGDYKWVINESGSPSAARTESDMIEAKVADCPARHAHSDNIAPVTPDQGKAFPDYASHGADDGTMLWTTSSASDGGLIFSLKLKQGGTIHEVLRTTSAPAAG